MRGLVLSIGGLAILAMSFFGTLYFLEPSNFQPLDEIRAADAKALKVAIEKYRAVHGKYPSTYFDNSVSDLKADLVGGGFIDKIPVDPYWTNGRVNQYRYRSTGKEYGLLIYLELGPCITGGTETVPWDGRKITACRF